MSHIESRGLTPVVTTRDVKAPELANKLSGGGDVSAFSSLTQAAKADNVKAQEPTSKTFEVHDTQFSGDAQNYVYVKNRFV